ncbi:MAG: glycerate kinase [Thermoplasmatales archaeon]|nr:MAG: glycerate kinase [Thermoplasmatales archaeon]
MFLKNYDQIVSNGQTQYLQKKRKNVLDIFTAALESANPYNAVKRVFEEGRIVFEAKVFDTSDFENIFVVGFGKASVGMVQAVCDFVTVSKGVVVTNDTSARLECDKIEVVIGGHPIPDHQSIKSAEKIIEVVKRCGEKDLLIVLVSGGGSALLCKPRVSLEDLQKTTNFLLRSGADINEINAIRKHLSYVKGGQLVRLAKGVVVSLIISDIVNDPIESIASGPTSPDSTTFSDAKKILEKYFLWDKVPVEVRKVVEDGLKGIIVETPKKDDSVFDEVHNFIIANNEIVCNAALDKAKSMGYKAKILTTSLTGEAKHAGNVLINKAENHRDKLTVFISGGETTVTIKGDGRGGRNQELVLGCVERIANSDIVLASFATDGIDGKSDAAGAIADGFTLSRANKKQLNPDKFLEENNSYEFFSELNDLLITGPSGTNVMDIQLIVI